MTTVAAIATSTKTPTKPSDNLFMVAAAKLGAGFLTIGIRFKSIPTGLFGVAVLGVALLVARGVDANRAVDAKRVHARAAVLAAQQAAVKAERDKYYGRG